MNTPYIYGELDRKSYYSQSDADIYNAINAAGWTLYTRILREHRGYFVKFDETTLTFTPNVQTYSLPPDVDQILHLAERATATERWHPMAATTLQDVIEHAQDKSGFFGNYYNGGLYGEQSRFSFYGPFLPATSISVSPGAPQIQQIMVEPAIDQTRFVQIAYTVAWVPVRDGSTKVYLPDDAESALIDWGCMELMRNNDDTLADRYAASAETKTQWLTSLMRQRQFASPPQVKLFGGWI